jgi:hypothetical protein
MELEMGFENGVDGKDKGKALTGKNTLNINHVTFS